MNMLTQAGCVDARMSAAAAAGENTYHNMKAIRRCGGEDVYSMCISRPTPAATKISARWAHHPA
eukprot:scaffold998_cov411-Prasinococcus_capsulatus_cf.AAC.23